MPACSNFEPVPSPWTAPLARRIDADEWMDAGPVGPDEMRRALEFLRRTNRWFGGARIFLRHLTEFSRSWRPGESIRILDVGTGLADIPVAIGRWARNRGWSISIDAVEKVPATAQWAREHAKAAPGVRILERDAFELGGERYDYVMASLFLHHIHSSSLVPLIRRLDGLASRGMIFGDLRRGRASYWSVKLLSNLLGNAVVRHDGPLSVRRAFTPDELRIAAREAGCGYLRARRERFFRVSLAGEKGPNP